LDRGNLTIIRAAAAELPHVELDDALRICQLLTSDPDAYERASVRWLGRLCLEHPDVTLSTVREAAEMFRRLPANPEPNVELLTKLARRPI
jgi:hypothetical protein